MEKCQTFFLTNKFFLRNVHEKLCRNFTFNSLVVGQVMELGRAKHHRNLKLYESSQQRRQRRIWQMMPSGWENSGGCKTAQWRNSGVENYNSGPLITLWLCSRLRGDVWITCMTGYETRNSCGHISIAPVVIVAAVLINMTCRSVSKTEKCSQSILFQKKSSAGWKSALSRRPVEERPISAPDSRTTYLKRDFYFSDFVVAALRDFKIRLL